MADIVSDFEDTVCTSTLGMDGSLGDALASEVSELVNQREVLDEEGAAVAGTH